MGNICCKKKRKYETTENGQESRLGRNNIELLEFNIVELIQTEVETNLEQHYIHESEENIKESASGKNNLELYLEDVFQNECLIKADEDEVEFIKTAVETLVQQIVDEVFDKFSTAKFGSQSKLETAIDHLKGSLVEVYFPIKENSIFQEWKHIKTATSHIIKVGSFFEGTKNNFPDEFDFIYLLFCSRYQTFGDYCTIMNFELGKLFHSHVKSIHYSFKDGNRELYLDNRQSVLSIPAYKLTFIYSNNLREIREIHVDLVCAKKILLANKIEWYIKYVDEHVEPKSFRDRLLSADSCLYIDNSIMLNQLTFTETEVSFIKTVLSRNHVKVYRILKFLLNGHGEYKERNSRCKTYSSYMIKTMMIYHHDECRNSDTTDLGACVIQVLEEMSKFKTLGKFPRFCDATIYAICALPVNQLLNLIQTLKSMQSTEDTYSYKKYVTTSVTQKFVTDNNILDKKIDLKLL